ncbi:MAG: hypothetical protein KC486_36285 [Myxococcales bacterium]|nr:hypothetical protein [Myxococcales bacterium]
MASPIHYGEAQAGKLTPDHLCDAPLFCSGPDGEAWWHAGQQWAAFVRGLVKILQGVEPAKGWPEELVLAVSLAEQNAKTFDGWGPWIVYEAEIAAWAAAQQYLRDVGGLLATRLRDKHGREAPPAPGKLDTLKPSTRAGYIAAGAIGALALVGVGVWIAHKRRAA